MGKSSEEYEMDQLERNYGNGLIDEKEYDIAMDELIRRLNGKERNER